MLTLGAYPFNFKLFKYIDINIGVKWLQIISSTVTGNYSEFGLAGNAAFDFSDSEEDILTTNQIGPTGRIAYVIKLSDKTSLTPQYNYYLGLSKEFNKYISTKFRQNHFIGIGLQIKI